jgi:hypothetical protein
MPPCVHHLPSQVQVAWVAQKFKLNRRSISFHPKATMSETSRYHIPYPAISLWYLDYQDSTRHYEHEMQNSAMTKFLVSLTSWDKYSQWAEPWNLPLQQPTTNLLRIAPFIHTLSCQQHPIKAIELHLWQHLHCTFTTQLLVFTYRTAHWHTEWVSKKLCKLWIAMRNMLFLCSQCRENITQPVNNATHQ